MKKLISIIVALVLVLSSTVVFADNGKGNKGNGWGNDKKYDKKAEYNKALKALKEMLKKYGKDKAKYQDIIDQILDLKDENDDESTSIFINGEEYSSSDGPVIKYKNFQLPTRPITKGLGARLTWDSYRHTITIIKGNVTLFMDLEHRIVKVNGAEVKNNILTSNKKNGTIVLIKFIAEILGRNVEIDEGAGAVVVEDDGSTSINDNITGRNLNQFEYSGKWSYGAQTNAFLGDNHWSGDKNSYYAVRFVGTQIRVFGAKANSHGIAAVSIDGGAETYIDLYSATRADNVEIYASPVLTQGLHTLKVRVTGDKNGSSSNTYVTADRVNISATGEIPQTGTNLALNKNSFADSIQTDNPASKANDGNTSTRWCAANGSFGHWWTVDLGALYNISGSEVTWEKAEKLYKYKVEVSADNANWTVKADKTNNTSRQQAQRDYYTANGVRFVKITVTEMESGCWASISEFKVFGTNASIDDQKPTAPSSLVASTPSATEVVLNWNASTDNIGVAGYKIFRNSVQVGNVTGSTSYRDTGLTPGTGYIYWVVAYDAAGNASDLSAPVVVTTSTSTDTQAPTVPTGLTAVAVSTTQVNLSWTTSTDNNGVAGYKVYRNHRFAAVVTNGTTYTDTGLSAGNAYVYNVTAYDIFGNESSESAIALAVTPLVNSSGLGLKAEYYDNSDFSNLKTVRIDENINFNWGAGSPVSSMGADTFSVRWTGQIQPLYSELYTFYTVSDDGVRLWVNGTKVIDNWTDHSSTENSGTIVLAAGQKYDIKVEYYDGGADAVIQLFWSSANQQKQIVPKSQLYPADADTQAPSVPTGLTAAAISASQINLNWTASTDNTGVAGYKVYRNGTLVNTVTTGTAYTDTGLAANTAYSYTVLAYDAAGNCSAQCLSVAATTQPLNGNLALNKTATSDSEETGNPASKANDGNLTTRWCARDGGFNHWWMVDLGGNYNVTGTEVNWEKNKAYKYKIDISTNGSTWTNVVDKTGNTTVTQTQTDRFTSISARYVRITVTGFDSDCWASFYEFKVF